MAYLFDTDAISEVLRRRPNLRYVEWLATVARESQYASAVSIGELYKGAFRSQHKDRHLMNIEERVLPVITVLPFDVAVARVFGEVRAHLEASGRPLPDADIQIASTAMFHGLQLVTGNIRHFDRIRGLHVHPVLHDSRKTR